MHSASGLLIISFTLEWFPREEYTSLAQIITGVDPKVAPGRKHGVQIWFAPLSTLDTDERAVDNQVRIADINPFKLQSPQQCRCRPFDVADVFTCEAQLSDKLIWGQPRSVVRTSTGASALQQINFSVNDHGTVCGIALSIARKSPCDLGRCQPLSRVRLRHRDFAPNAY